MLPASWIGMVPRDRPMPKSLYRPAPLSRMIGTAASDSTLLITVGRPNRPLMRRQRRLGAHQAALAFQAFSSEVSSPQT